MTDEPYVLVLYYSTGGATKSLAMEIARGIDSVPGIHPKIRTVPDIQSANDSTVPSSANTAHPFCKKEELRLCSGLFMGSGTRFGNMAAQLKYFLDSTADIWSSNQLEGKPASVFCSSSSMHGGQESTLLSMMIPLLHHGMVITGVPYSVGELGATRSGGSPYGPSHVTGEGKTFFKLSQDEVTIARKAGERIARLALKLS